MVARKTFGLQWDTVFSVSVYLPYGLGVTQYSMGPETRSNRSLTADVIMASKTIKGVRDGVPKTLVVKRGKRIRKGPGMPCVDVGSALVTDATKDE